MSKSPQIHPDNSVTFHVIAPNAKTVTLTGGTVQLRLGLAAGAELPFTQTEERWELTTPPLPAGSYSYQIEIDGVGFVDPENFAVKVGAMAAFSLFQIAGEAAEYFMPQDVPHGVIHRHTYHSDVANAFRDLHIYTPPNYDPSGAPLPVLYLLHGSGELGYSWSQIGAAGTIADNLLAAGKIRPMLIAMPNGHIATDFHNKTDAFYATNFTNMEAELFDHVIPLVEGAYNVQTERNGRALAGLSMGGMQTECVGFARLDQFCALGLFSGTLYGRKQFGAYLGEEISAENLNTLDDLFLGCGLQDDWFIDDYAKLHERLTERNVNHRYFTMQGGHSWAVWRHLLAFEWLPYLWQQ